VSRARVGGRRLPVSAHFGYDRGLPIDRFYIEHFLARFACRPGYLAGDIRGHVLEVGGRDYVDRFGIAGDQPGPGVVHSVDVLHESVIDPQATLVGDLAEAGTLPAARFDCVICTQVLPLIWDTRAVLASLYQSLRLNGVLLLTVPGISRSIAPESDQWSDYWRFTSVSARRLVSEAFPGGQVEVDAYGNVQSAAFALYGFAAHELSTERLMLRDPAYEVIIGVRAMRKERWSAGDASAS